MSQQSGPQGPPVMAVASGYGPQPEGPSMPGAVVVHETEASSTDCSELSGHPESSTSGGEEVTLLPPGGDEEVRRQSPDGSSVSRRRDSDVDPVDEGTAETREMWTQSPPEVAVQIDEPVTPPPSAQTNDEAEAAEIGIDEEENAKGHSGGEGPKGVVANEKPVAEERPQAAQRPSRRRNNRGRNNKVSIPLIQSDDPIPAEVPSTPPIVIPHHDEVAVLEPEAPEPVQFIQETLDEVEERPSAEPVQELSEVLKAEPPPSKVDLIPPTPVMESTPPLEEEAVISKFAPTPVLQVAPERAQPTSEPLRSKPEPIERQVEKVERTKMENNDALLPHVQGGQIFKEVEPTNDRLSPEPASTLVAEPVEVKPPSTLPVDTFTFKPEPYKHPMLKSPKTELKEEPSLITEVLNRETNGEANLHHVEESEGKMREDCPPSRHLQDMPRRKARLKKPPEREQTPGIRIEDIIAVEGVPEIADVTLSLDSHVNEKEAAPAVIRSPDNNREVERGLTQDPADEDTASKEETLTEVVSKWLEENSDALPESLEEMKGGGGELKKTEAAVVDDEEGNTTGSKNGVRNPFPAPSSSRLPVESERSECVCVCGSSECSCAFSGDGPVKRVANRIFGAGDEGAKTEEETEGRERGEGGRVDGDDDEDRGSCEWEPMTVEVPRRNFSDLESWKRIRGGSVEALRSLGSYRDEDEDEETRRTRLDMCDPTASVAKYYCLGATREIKSPSPGEGPNVQRDSAPTDSGVQTDEEDEMVSPVATAEEAREEVVPQSRRFRVHHKPVGFGKTAAFVARQIGASESAKGPFPCGICCILQ